MILDWTSSRPRCFVDFETRSQVELTTVHKYTSHESTQVLCLVAKPEGQPAMRFGPYEGPIPDEDRAALAALAGTHTLVAHNAPFDSAVWERVAGLPEAAWEDTLPRARAAALPGKLDALGKLITGEGKDPRGKQLIDLLCKPHGKLPWTAFRDPDGRPQPSYRKLLDYCVRDVELLEAVYRRVKPYGEPLIMTVDAEINARGMPADRQYADALVGLYRCNAETVGSKFSKVTGGVNPGSPKQVKEWLKSRGFRVPEVDGKESIGKFALKKLLCDPEEFFDGGDVEGDDAEAFAAAATELKEAMELRRGVVRVGGSKAETARSLVDGGRIREQLIYYGAHTGRWSSRGLQLHNMPVQRCSIEDVELYMSSVEAAAARATEEAGEPVQAVDVLNSMLRGVVRCESLMAADYAAVELRGLAWLAGADRMLGILSDPGRSIYCDIGERVFGRPITKKDQEEYTLAKALVLGCGYGMSGFKFEYICKSRDVKTRKLGMDVKDAVKVFRSTYPELTALWKDFGSAALDAARYGADRLVGRCVLFRCGSDMHMQLPSRRVIVYRDVAVEKVRPSYADMYCMPEDYRVDTVVYTTPRGFRTCLYGSKLTENAVQAVCRDFLAEALLSLTQLGFTPVLHVHDEAVCEDGPEKFREFMEVMSSPPAWAPDFPLAAEGYCGKVWTKAPKSVVTYMRGKEVLR